MIHSYKITGMSCEGCSNKVEKTLNTINGITAIVTLNPPVATITMEKHIPTEQLQEALSKVGNYTIAITNANETVSHEEDKTVKKSCC